MAECIFCKVVAGELPSFKVYEDSSTVAFLDIFPIHPGHVLVVPKKHSVDIFDTDEATLKQMIAVAKKIAPAVLEAAKADAINIGMNNRKEAGQEVFHAHMHVIPRYGNDGLKAWGKNLFRDDKHKKQLHTAILRELQ